jgi:aliphatic sulfonates family ABC transporter substrate-binding protein
MSNMTRRDLLSSALATAAGASVLGAPHFAGAAETPIKIRFGWQPTLNAARYFAAHDAGIFKTNGIDVEQIKFLAGPPFFAAFQSGSIDVGFMGTPPASVGIAQGVPMKIFAVENYAYGSEGLVATKKSGIKSLKDLKGKRVAAQRGTSGHYGLIRGLEKAGLTIKDIHFIDLNVTVLLPAFSKGEIDAGWYWEPWQGEMRDAGGVQIATDEDVGAAGGIVWVARTEWLDKNPEAVQRLLRSLDQASALLAKQTAKIASYLHSDIGVSVELAKTVMTKEAKWPLMHEEWDPSYVLSMNPQAIESGKGLIAVLNKLANFQYQVSAIKRVPDFKAAIDTKPLARYVKG